MRADDPPDDAEPLGHDIDQLWTERDIERLTNGAVKASTLRWWRHRGDVGPRWFRIGQRKVVYKASDVVGWLDQQYRNGAA